MIPKSALAGLFLFFLLPSFVFSAPQLLQLRLKTPLTSYKTKPGAPFECVVLAPWVANGRVVIPEGATVSGHVAKVASVGLGIVHERARLDLVFDKFTTADGVEFPLYGRLASVDNAREQVTAKGTIRGVIAARQPNALLFGLWSSPSADMLSRSLMGVTGISHQISTALSLGPMGQGGLLALRFALIRFPEPEIQYAAGTDMALVLDSDQPGISETPVLPPPAPAAVSDWLRKEPFNIDRSGNRPVSDIVNMAFLGSREQLIRAFTTAGWSQADTHKSVSKMYYAYSSMRAYATAPVTALFYKGILPGLVFQKSLNSIDKRHHIRIWYAGVVDGNELWLGAATHDTSIGFNRHSFTFTHRIDSHIDEERDKVTTDLRFVGCTAGEMRVDRPDAASSGLSSFTVTDGAATILPITDCDPQHAFETTALPKVSNPVNRIARRVILESRNHVFRENVYYWTFQYLKHRHDEHVKLAPQAQTEATFASVK